MCPGGCRPIRINFARQKTEKQSPAELTLEFDYDQQDSEENLTSWSGVPFYGRLSVRWACRKA